MGKDNKNLRVSAAEARKISVYFQGLTSGAPFGRGREGARAALEHLGYVQIDTIHVVERAHHHVLWSRVPGYEAGQLDTLVREGTAFEYWSHAASFLPMKDFRYSLPRKKRFSTGESHWFKPTKEHARWRKTIVKRIREEGALCARDFSAPGKKKGSGWFERGPAKQALEQLFMEGKLMIAGRDGFQKRYDLTERVLPPGVDASFPTEEEQARHLIFSHLRAHGFARSGEISYLRPSFRRRVEETSAKLLRKGELQLLEVEGVSEPFLVATGEFGARAEEALKAAPRIALLSPFDNFVIRRKRLKELFGFDYLLECYLPEKQRRFGYFCLPVLDGDRFCGRIDAKAFRNERRLEIRSLHPHGRLSRKGLLEKIQPELESFAAFNGCEYQ